MSGKKVVGVVLLLVGAAFLGAGFMAWRLYGLAMSVEPPVASPGGTSVASLSVTDSRGEEKTHLRLVVEIREAGKPEVLFRRQTRASSMRAYELKWGDDATLYLTSKEIGDLKWVRDQDGLWRDDPANADRVVPPVAPATSPSPATVPVK